MDILDYMGPLGTTGMFTLLRYLTRMLNAMRRFDGVLRAFHRAFCSYAHLG